MQFYGTYGTNVDTRTSLTESGQGTESNAALTNKNIRKWLLKRQDGLLLEEWCGSLCFWA